MTRAAVQFAWEYKHAAVFFIPRRSSLLYLYHRENKEQIVYVLEEEYNFTFILLHNDRSFRVDKERLQYYAIINHLLYQK